MSTEDSGKEIVDALAGEDKSGTEIVDALAGEDENGAGSGDEHDVRGKWCKVCCVIPTKTKGCWCDYAQEKPMHPLVRQLVDTTVPGAPVPGSFGPVARTVVFLAEAKWAFKFTVQKSPQPVSEREKLCNKLNNVCRNLCNPHLGVHLMTEINIMATPGPTQRRLVYENYDAFKALGNWKKTYVASTVVGVGSMDGPCKNCGITREDRSNVRFVADKYESGKQYCNNCDSNIKNKDKQKNKKRKTSAASVHDGEHDIGDGQKPMQQTQQPGQGSQFQHPQQQAHGQHLVQVQQALPSAGLQPMTQAQSPAVGPSVGQAPFAGRGYLSGLDILGARAPSGHGGSPSDHAASGGHPAPVGRGYVNGPGSVPFGAQGPSGSHASSGGPAAPFGRGFVGGPGSIPFGHQGPSGSHTAPGGHAAPPVGRGFVTGPGSAPFGAQGPPGGHAHFGNPAPYAPPAPLHPDFDDFLDPTLYSAGQPQGAAGQQDQPMEDTEPQQ